MEQFVGLDVSQKLTHICVVDREGKALWRGSSSATPEYIAATVRAHASGAVRIGFETGALSTWLWHGLKKIGLPIVCLDARHDMLSLGLGAAPAFSSAGADKIALNVRQPAENGNHQAPGAGAGIGPRL